MRNLAPIVAVVFVLAASPLLAEETIEKPQPTAEHKKLELWVGKWTGTGEMKSGPFGPGGPMTWTEECSWFAGAGFNVVCKSSSDTPMGPAKGLGIVGYHPDKQVYTHYGVDSTGWSGYSEGTRSGDSWTFKSTDTMGGMTFHSRFTMKMVSPKEMTFVWEMSEDGESWTAMMEGSSKKQ